MTIDKLKSILACILLASLIALSVRMFVLINTLSPRLSYAMEAGGNAAQNVNKASGRAQEFLDAQLTLFQSEPYQKSLRASFETGAVYNGTGRLLNTQVLPRVMKDLDRLDGLIIALTQNSQTLSSFIADTNHSVNQSLLPQATALLASLMQDADRFGLTIETLNTMLKIIADKSGMTLDEVYKLAASPEWKAALANVDTITANLASTTRHVDLSAAQIEDAMKSAPGIAKALEKISTTSAKYSKALLIVQILSVIGKAFLL